MHFFDFLSSPPNLFILQEKKAKTNCGGILFCFYIIIMLSISLAYKIKYAVNDKYSVEIKIIDNTTNNQIPFHYMYKKESDIPYFRLDDDEELNPLLNISIYARGDFKIYENSRNTQKYLDGDCIDEKHSEYLYNITTRVSDLLYWDGNGLEFHYICGNDSNCSSIDNQKRLERSFHLGFPGFKLDHQAEIPFQIDRDELYVFPRIFDFDDPNKGAIMEFDWEVIQYKDKPTIFDSFMNNKKKPTTFGHFKPEYKITYTEMTPKEKYIKYKYDDKYNKIYYMNFLTITFNNNHYEYLLYERTKKEFLDILASIGALFSTIKFFFDFVFSFYSRNFNNYKVMEKLLSSSKGHFKKIEINSEFKDSINQSTDEENNNLIKDKEKNDSLIDKLSDENKEENEINIQKNEIDIKKADEDVPIVLDKLPFIDFFYNNIYCKCCKKRRNQELINLINKISYKYLSMEALLYNQLILEGLFKDYNWNNPSLKNILNNTMIKELKDI